MTEDQEKELLAFAQERIAKKLLMSRLRFGGNIDNFASDNSQVIFLDKPNIPPRETAEPWTVIIDGPYTVTSITQFVYTDGETYDNTTVLPAVPMFIRYTEGDREVFSPVTGPQLDYAVYDVPGSYTGSFRQSTIVNFSVRNFEFGVRLELLRSEQEIIDGQVQGPITETTNFVELPSSEVVEYPVEPAENTRVTITPVAITRL